MAREIDINVLIAVRGGSKRVPRKNVRPFCGSSMLEIKVKQAKRCLK
jgi:CMP-N-acetylneuraminic acid synthetase